MGYHRTAVADFWDEVLERWVDGRDHIIGPLQRWIDSYHGTGKGAVDLNHYPDPYVGDLRGEASEPKMVILGLNPGVGYDQLQGPSGTWTNRIRKHGYSRCFQRSPAEDPTSWLALHQRPSAYWNALLKFTARWLEEDQANVTDVLGFELYPWHSSAVTAPIRPPADLIDTYVWAPVSEIDVPVVFALGAPWFEVADALGLPQVALFGKGGEPFAGKVNERAHWRVGVYELPSGQYLVVNSQSGSGQPPGEDRTAILRTTLEPFLAQPAPQVPAPARGLLPRDVECNRCGRPATHLVAGGEDSNAPGRLLAYCQLCQQGISLSLAIPLGVVTQDPAGIMTALYQGGATSTNPDMVAERFPFVGRAWVQSAWRSLREGPGHGRRRLT